MIQVIIAVGAVHQIIYAALRFGRIKVLVKAVPEAYSAFPAFVRPEGINE
jgi:hypothetical protein